MEIAGNSIVDFSKYVFLITTITSRQELLGPMALTINRNLAFENLNDLLFSKKCYNEKMHNASYNS